MSSTFTCEACGRPGAKGRTDEDALAEARGIYSEAELATTGLVCDGCFPLLMAELPRIRAEIGQEAAAEGLSYDEFVLRESAQP